MATPVADDVLGSTAPPDPQARSPHSTPLSFQSLPLQDTPPLLARQLRSTLTLMALAVDGVCCEGLASTRVVREVFSVMSDGWIVLAAPSVLF